MAKYVVKFGDLYSCGRPAEGDGLMSLALSDQRREAWVTSERPLAEAHAVAWFDEAIERGAQAPRVVKLKKRDQ